jgi:membrane associated rhomboid family serine protease
MFVLYQFGRFAEEQVFPLLFGANMGKFVYLLFYLAAIVLSSIPTYFRHQNNYGYAALGASGATSALVFTYILFDPWQWFIFPPLPAILVGIGFLVYSSYMDKRGNDNIGHNAHLWGAIFGLFFTIGSIMLLQPQYLDFILTQLFAGPRPFGQ